MGGDHAYRLFSQTDTDGAGNDGSLNAPTGIPNRVEPVSRVQQIVTPQVGQKWWLIRVPALLVRVYILLGPFRRTVSFGKYALLVHGTPDRRWQSRQWHTLTTIGSAETMTLNAPYRHLAVLGELMLGISLLRDPCVGERRCSALPLDRAYKLPQRKRMEVDRKWRKKSRDHHRRVGEGVR